VFSINVGLIALDKPWSLHRSRPEPALELPIGDRPRLSPENNRGPSAIFSIILIVPNAAMTKRNYSA